MSDATPPDYSDLPDTKDLVPPTSDEIPLWVLANTIALRAVLRDLQTLRRFFTTWGWRIVGALLGGGVTMAGAVVGTAMERGEERERLAHTTVAVDDLDERVTYLERKNDGRARRGRESEE